PNSTCRSAGLIRASSSSLGCSDSSTYGQKRSSGRNSGRSGNSRSGRFVAVMAPVRDAILNVRTPQHTMPSRRAIPSLERLLERPALVALARRHGRASVLDAARRAADTYRTTMAREATGDEDSATGGDDVSLWLEQQIETDLSARLSTSLRP